MIRGQLFKGEMMGKKSEFTVYKEKNAVMLAQGNIEYRVDREEFIPDVINYLNGGEINGRRYIIETKIVVPVVFDSPVTEQPA